MDIIPITPERGWPLPDLYDGIDPNPWAVFDHPHDQPMKHEYRWYMDLPGIPDFGNTAILLTYLEHVFCSELANRIRGPTRHSLFTIALVQAYRVLGTDTSVGDVAGMVDWSAY